MAKRRRGRGTQLKCNQSKKSSSESVLLEDNGQKPHSKKVNKNNQSASGSDVASFEDVDSTTTIQEDELDLISNSFDGFTGPGPCKVSKLKSLTSILHHEQTLTSRKYSSKLNRSTDVNPSAFQDKNKGVKSCNDSSVCMNKSQAKLFIKCELPGQFVNNDINLVGSIGSKIKIEMGDRSGINDHLFTNTDIDSNPPESLLKSPNEDNTDYKSLFEAVCKHIKIPTNISKNELFRTLNEKYLTGVNSSDIKVNVRRDDSIKEAATIVDIPSIMKVTSEMADIDTKASISEGDGAKINLTFIKTEPDIESPVKKFEIASKVASVPRNYVDINNSKLDLGKSHSKSARKKHCLNLPVEEKGQIMKKLLKENLEESHGMKQYVNNFSFCEKEDGNSEVKFSNLPYSSEMGEIENKSPKIINEIDNKSSSTTEVKKERNIDYAGPAIIQDVAMIKTAIVEIKNESLLVSEEKEALMQIKLSNRIAAGNCALNIKVKSELSLECNKIESVSSLSSEKDGCEVQDEICLKIIEEKSLHTSKFIEKACPIDDKHGIVNVEEFSVEDNSTGDIAKLINRSADVNCVGNKSGYCVGNFRTPPMNIKYEMSTPITSQCNDCVTSNNIDVLSKCHNLKSGCADSKSPLENDNVAEEDRTMSVTIDNTIVPSSRNIESNRVEEIDNIVDSKLKKVASSTKNKINRIEEETYNIVDSKLKEVASSTKSEINRIKEETDNIVDSELKEVASSSKSEINRKEEQTDNIVDSELKEVVSPTKRESNRIKEETDNIVDSEWKISSSSTKNESNTLKEEINNIIDCKVKKVPNFTKDESNRKEEKITNLVESKLKNPLSSKKVGNDKIEDKVNIIVDCKLNIDMPLMDFSQVSKIHEPKEESRNHVDLSNKCIISTLPDCNNKSNEMENLVPGVANDAEDIAEDNTDCDLNYSDFFVIDEVNDKFYLEVCDLEKDFKLSDKDKKVYMKSTNTTKQERNDKKSEQDNKSTSGSIPGLSFIIGMKEDKKLNKAVYDCVLCTWDKNSMMMSGIEMKTHVKTRSHLMNLLRMQNYPLYERYNNKDSAWVMTSSLLETVLKIEATMAEQTIVAASKENYSLKRKKIIARINELNVIGNIGKIPQEAITSAPKKDIEVAAKPFSDPQISKPAHVSMTSLTDAPFQQTSQPFLPAVNSFFSLNFDTHSQQLQSSAPVCMEPFKSQALLQPMISAPFCMESASTGPVIPTSNNYPVVITTPSSIESKPVISANLSTSNSEHRQMSVFDKSTLPYKNINTQIMNNATVSAPFVPASSKSVTLSVSSLSTSKYRKDLDCSSKATMSASSIPAEILMPPPLSASVPSKLKKKAINISAPAIPLPPIDSPVPLAAPILLPAPILLHVPIHLPSSEVLGVTLPKKPVVTLSKKPVVTPVKMCDYDQVAIVSDCRYESFLKSLRKEPNVLILSRPDLKLNDLCDFITNNLKFVGGQKRTLYLVVTGIHSVTNLAPANSCSVSNCKHPLEALNSLDDAKYCGEPARFANLFAEKLISAVNSIIPILPTNSNIGILPPLPISLISVGVTHKKLHEKKLMFPYYMIANRKASIASLYSFWMDGITTIAHKSLSNLKKINQSLLRKLVENKKLKEMDCSAQDNPSYNLWKEIVIDIIESAIPRKTNVTNKVLKEDAENWQKSIEKLSRPKANNTITAELSSDYLTKIAYDHLVFIGHSTSLKLLPEIKFCHNTKWDFEEIVESQNLFIKMDALNKMAIKKVLFIIISDIAMIGIKERNPECLVKKCGKTLTNIHTQLKKQSSNKIRATIFMPIDIIITEIKKFCIFESRVVVAPFTPCTYLFVPNMNAEIKFHSKMHDFLRFQSSVCFLKGSTKINWDQTLRSFEIEWGKLALEIPQETMEHINYVKQILTEITTKDYNPVTWKNLSVDSPVDVDSSLTIWKLYVEELAMKAWVERVVTVPVAGSGLLPLFPSVTGLQSKTLQTKVALIPDAKNKQINLVQNITPKKIIMPNFKNVSLPGAPKVIEVERLELNRDHNEVIKFTKEILNARRVKKMETEIAPIFNSVYIVRHVNQQVSQKELTNPFYECNFKSKMIFHNFSKYDESDLKRLLAKLGDYPAKSLCCLVFDLSVIATKLAMSSGCKSHSCNPVLLVNGLETKSSLSSQALQELDQLIDNQLKGIAAFVQKLNKRISVLILPLVPTMIFCDDENNIDHQTSHAISNMGAYFVNGSHALWKRAFQTLIPSWNQIMEKYNREYDFYNYISTYTASNANTFLLLDNVSDFTTKWIEPNIWKAFAEVILLSLVPKKNSISDSGIRFMSEKTLVSISITGITSAIPYGFLEELFKSVDGKVIIEMAKEMCTVRNIMLQRAVLLTKILNEHRVGDGTFSATLHGISGPVNTETNLMQNLYITSIFAKVYSSWKSPIITNFIKGIEGFDVTTLKTTPCEKGFICQGTKCCAHYHSHLDRRRNPLQIPYKQQLCHHPKESDGACKVSDQCSLSRNIFEQNFHPFSYQVKLCPSRASSEICNKRELCKYAHKDCPELLFTSDWQDMIVVGADNVFKFFAGAIRGSKKLQNSNNFKIILVSPSAEVLDLLITVCDELIKAFGLKVFMLGKNLDKSDNCDIIVGEPQSFVELDTMILSAMTGVIIVDDIRSILDHQEQADALSNLIRRVKQTSVDYLTKVGLVVTCATEKSYISAGGAKYFSNALNTILHEPDSRTDISIIYTSVAEKISQPQTTMLSSSKRKDYSRSRSRSREKKLCLASNSSNVSGSASSSSDRQHKRSRSNSSDRSHRYGHKSSSHSRRSCSRSRDRKRRDHSRTSDHNRRSRSRDRKKRSRSGSLPRDKNKSKFYVQTDGSKYNDKSQLATGEYVGNNDWTRTSSTTASVSNKENTKSHSMSPLSSITNYSELFSESYSRSLQEKGNLVPLQKHEYCYEDRTSSPSSKMSGTLRMEESSYSYHNSDNVPTHSDLNLETGLIYRLGTKLYEEYVAMLKIQKQLFEKEFPVFRNVPELCPSYGHYYEAFSSMYTMQHGYKGEEHKGRLWKLYWMSKFEEIKNEGWQSRQLKLLEEFEKKASIHSINTSQVQYEAIPGTSFSTIPYSTTRLETVHGQSSSSYEVNVIGSDEEENLFNFENALTILEKLCDHIGFLGPALNAMVLKCKELGPSEEAFTVFTLSENVMVVNMVLDKVKTLKLSASGSLVDVYERAIETIPQLLMETKNGPKPKVNKPTEDVPIDIIAIARVSMGKSSDFTLNLLKTALQYEGISNPSKELINDLYLKVCKMQYKLSTDD